MKCSKSFWKSQFHIFVATSIPFTGVSILKLGVKNLFEGAYESLEKPKWAPDLWFFTLSRWIVLTLFGYASYRVWLSSKKFSQKLLVTFSVYLVMLFADWLSIFLDPTHLDFASKYYAFIAALALVTTFLFFKFDAFSLLCTFPYIFWLLFMTVFCHLLHEANHDNWWFFNEDLSVHLESNNSINYIKN